MSAAPKTPIRQAGWHPVIPDPDECRRRMDLLTPREEQILGLVAHGWPPKQIARLLGISHKTVCNALGRVYQCLGVDPGGYQALAVLARASDAVASEVVPLRRRSDFDPATERRAS